MLAVTLGFVLFNAESLQQCGQDIACLFGFGKLPFVTAETVYYLKSYAVLFVIGMVGATPLVRNLSRRVGDTKVGMILEPVLCIILLLICTAYLVDGSFSPFLYFRF